MPGEAPRTKKAPLTRRLLWFVALYAGGVLAIGTLAFALRFVTH
ncbi:MAG: DUF2474 family protein [Rhodoblastus sp.]